MLGTDRIGHWEHVVVSYFKGLLKWPVSTQAAEEEIERANDALEKAEKVALENAAGKRILEEQSQEQYAAAELYDHGYKEAEKANSGANASKSPHKLHSSVLPWSVASRMVVCGCAWCNI